jgi:predicted DsbA family dithiol-disulfide isomerase
MITVEIWSDLVCPFCYIGKRNFEAALSRFDRKGDVKIIWKSFELDPEARYEPGVSVHEHLAEKYGQSVEWAKDATARVASMAAEAGIKFAIDRTVPTNTFDAHRLVHLAAARGIGDKAEELIFSAYFTEGKQIGDKAVLTKIASDIGVPSDDAVGLLEGDKYSDEVREDEKEGQKLGISGVPCFVINRKYMVRGAQPPDVLLKALETAAKGD